MLIRPDMKEASRVCIGITAAAMVISILHTFPGKVEKCTQLAGTVAVSVMLLTSTGSLINLATKTIYEISEYGRLLLPVLATALGAQGGVTTSSALYAGTVLFDSVLSGLISHFLTPITYLYLALASAVSAVGEEMLKRLRDLLKWFMTWSLKTLLYIFTGFISITGVISGPTDAAALKVAKLTISGMVPVVGGVISDAAESLLAGAAAIRGMTGVFGVLCIIAICLIPFVKMGINYLLFKSGTAILSIFCSKEITGYLSALSNSFGMILGMLGTCAAVLFFEIVFSIVLIGG
jgi:stage III sporulation protein AE